MWYPHILKNVNLVIDKAGLLARYGAECKDNAKLSIKYRPDNGMTLVGNIVYLPPKEWSKQTNLAEAITFNMDPNYFDFFVVGVVDSLDPVKDEDYPDGFFEHKKKDEDFCFAITSVSKFDMIPHFEILAK